MSAYQVSEDVDAGKQFIVNYSELEGCYSPLFFISKPQKINHAKRLRDIALVNPTRSRPKFEEDDLVPYVGLPETDEDTHSINEVVLRPYKEVAGRNIIFPDEILFARIEPSIFNKKYILTDDLNGYNFAFTSTEFYVVKGDKTSNEYLFCCLLSDYVYNQVIGKTTGATGRRRLDLDVFEKLLIPFPDRLIQDVAVEHFRKFVNQKTEKETKAAEQMARIDDYLLAELGICVPEADDALENRIFTVNFSESSGKRFDPLFFYHNFLDQVSAGRYPVELLGRHVAYFQTGFAAGKGDQSTDASDVIQLRPTNLNDDRELVFDRNVYIHREALEKRPGDSLRPGEVLFNNTNSQELVGKSALFDLDGAYFCSNHMTRIGTEASLHPDYLAHLLNLYQRQNMFFRVCTNWNNQSGVNNGVLSGILIPIPPVNQQIAIAETITDLRNKAKKLRREAKEDLEKARQEVERMILAE